MIARFAALLRGALMRPEGLLAGSFAALIVAGSVALSLNACQVRGDVSYLDALFTSTSAVCVTGLTVVDTATDYSRAGQTVILALIQLGGLGIMTFAAVAFTLFGGRMSLRSYAALQDAFYQSPSATRLKRTLVWIVALTFAIEAGGALLMLPAFRRAGMTAYEAVFHSVSAFCNAGFSTRSDSLVGLSGEHGLLLVFMALIVLGGMGYSVLFEILARGWARARGRHSDPLNWSLHSSVVLRASGWLVLAGAAGLLALGASDRAEDSWLQRAAMGAFHSVSARTAGFNAVDIGRLPLPSLLLLIGLMFVGGSPGSCAGGIKTTSLAIGGAALRSLAAGREEVTLLRRRVPEEVVRRALTVVGLALLFNLAGVLLLSVLEGGNGRRLEEIVFEQVSAFGTVGLSTGITPGLTALSKAWVMVTMFVGRVGPLTLALVVVARRPPPARYPQERVMVG